MGAAPSREATSLFSYFRGSYEVGLIPLTRHFFGSDADEAREKESPPSTVHALFTASQVDHAGRTSTVPSPSHHLQPESRRSLRAQLLQMRRDPAVLYFNARDPDGMQQSAEDYLKRLRARVTPHPADGGADAADNGQGTPPEEEVEEALRTAYWDIVPNENFAEEDLDAFLDLVEKQLYESDEAMVSDPFYEGEGSPSGTAPRSVRREAPESGGGARRFAPVPCALCLAYPEGKGRPGCFSVDRRSINLIGYFGLLTPEMQRVFKVCKRATSPAEAEPHGAPPAPAGLPLRLCTSILTSAGDRTLERVLVLAAVMLRHQFHSAYRRTLIRRNGGPSTAAALAAEWRARGLGPSAGPLDERAASLADPILELPLPPLLPSMFTPNPRNYDGKEAAPSSFLDTAAEAVHAHRQRLFFRDPGEPEAGGAAPADREASTSPSSYHLSTEEEDAITAGFGERLGHISVVIETASNNYSALKSLTENFAFLRSQLRMDPAALSVELTAFPPAAPCDGKKDDDKDDDDASNKEVPLAPNSCIIMHLQPDYFRQSTLWASCLFHYPGRLPGGHWIQYKLKDECNALRQTLQRKDVLVVKWRQREMELASTYLGPDTLRLLSHVKMLQEETERARELPLTYWESRPLFVSQNGRQYGLQQSPHGPILIGVRTHSVESPTKPSATAEETTWSLAPPPAAHPWEMAAGTGATPRPSRGPPPRDAAAARGGPKRGRRPTGALRGLPAASHPGYPVRSLYTPSPAGGEVLRPLPPPPTPPAFVPAYGVRGGVPFVAALGREVTSAAGGICLSPQPAVSNTVTGHVSRLYYIPSAATPTDFDPTGTPSRAVSMMNDVPGVIVPLLASPTPHPGVCVPPSHVAYSSDQSIRSGRNVSSASSITMPVLGTSSVNVSSFHLAELPTPPLQATSTRFEHPMGLTLPLYGQFSPTPTVESVAGSVSGYGSMGMVSPTPHHPGGPSALHTARHPLHQSPVEAVHRLHSNRLPSAPPWSASHDPNNGPGISGVMLYQPSACSEAGSACPISIHVTSPPPGCSSPSNHCSIGSLHNAMGSTGTSSLPPHLTPSPVMAQGHSQRSFHSAGGRMHPAPRTLLTHTGHLVMPISGTPSLAYPTDHLERATHSAPPVDHSSASQPLTAYYLYDTASVMVKSVPEYKGAAISLEPRQFTPAFVLPFPPAP